MALQWLLIGLGLLFLAILAVKHFVNASPAAMTSALRKFAVAAIVVVGLFLIATGRLPWQALIALFLLPLARVLFGGGTSGARRQEWKTGQSSQVTTKFLRMALDHDSGELDGTVLQGAFSGRRLSSMSLDELRRLVAEVSDDADSFNILTAYLDRAHGEAWRETADGAETNRRAAPDGAMTREEAYKVLGLEPGASEDQIRAAHRRLMKLSHPDHGGSDYLASKINEAKDLLLSE
jgi:DnaJ-domain-containing protein 1